MATELRKLVEAWGWSGARLGRRAGISHARACAALRGKHIGLISRRRIADALNREVGSDQWDANDVKNMTEGEHDA